MEKLLPCPFCGGNAELRDYEGEMFCVVCCDNKLGMMCFCAMGEGYDRDAMPDHSFISAELAVKAWNTRAPQWQTIESAPRDGTQIIVCAMRCYEPFGIICQVMYHDDNWVDADTGIKFHNPERWLPMSALPPLPAPPEVG